MIGHIQRYPSLLRFVVAREGASSPGLPLSPGPPVPTQRYPSLLRFVVAREGASSPGLSLSPGPPGHIQRYPSLLRFVVAREGAGNPRRDTGYSGFKLDFDSVRLHHDGQGVPIHAVRRCSKIGSEDLDR
jgi:hypothetical protein